MINKVIFSYNEVNQSVVTHVTNRSICHRYIKRCIYSTTSLLHRTSQLLSCNGETNMSDLWEELFYYYNLQRHNKTVHGFVRYQCPVCIKRTTRKDSLRAHIKRMHSIEHEVIMIQMMMKKKMIMMIQMMKCKIYMNCKIKRYICIA